MIVGKLSFAQESDSLKLQLQPESDNPFQPSNQSNINLNTPSNIKSDVEYNTETNQYELKQSIGDDQGIKFRPDASMDLDDYLQYDMQKSLNNYWNQKAQEQGKSTRNNNRPELDLKNETVDRIFGGSEVDIRPNGQAQLTFGIERNKNQNPVIPVRNQTTTNFDFDMKIQLNVVGKIGEKLKLTTNYNTEATFDWQNQMKLEYTGFEDEIIKKIEAGNVSMPLKSSLITGSQSLFGIKTEMQFGKLYVTSILSQQKGNKKEISVQGGAQINDFEVKADSYEENKHFFLSHYFRDHYEEWLENPTAISSPINITRIEVWVTNTNTATDDTRNVIGFQDLGEENPSHFYNNAIVNATLGAPPYPNNTANNLYTNLANDDDVRSFINATGALTDKFNMTGKRDYQKIELARKLSENEFTFHPQLGYISMRQEVNINQAIAVAFQYTYRGEVFQVGQFSDEIQGQDALILKMLKSTERNVRIPMWDLMMKNIYSIGAYNVQRDGFELDIWYLNPKTGIDNNYISVPGIDPENDNFQLIRLLNLDSLDVNQNVRSDGVFDFIPEVTIVPSNGRLIFPVLEPFGEFMRSLFPNQADADKYAFDSLYTTTKANAQVKFPDKNRYTIKGKTKGAAGSDISLGAMNISEGSVLVTHGGMPLQEGVDYQVDYQIGRVTVINQSILESGTPIKVSLESQDLFGIQSKTLMGSRFDYTLSEDILLGGTIMRLTERPLTQKVNYGDEPMANTIVGVDGSYKKESQLLTTLVDKLPLIETKEKSIITFDAEAAKLIPGHSSALADEGTSYIDDFEGSQTSIDLKGGAITQWVLASTPQGQPDLFKEGSLVNDVAFNFNRAKLAWYVLDPLFWRPDNTTPEHIKNDEDMRSNHFMRVVWQDEVFPNKSPNYNAPNNLSMFDLAYYPTERGQYNYDVDGKSITGTQFGYGMDENGLLKNPEQRWGGIMRKLETNDFDAANVEFIQFWLMDPFAEEDKEGFPDANTDGELYFNIGEISEDVLRDGRKSFEQGLPTTLQETEDLSDSSNFTAFGRIPPLGTQAIVHSFDNENDSREFQDVGMEGLRDEEERTFFQKIFIKKIEDQLTTSSLAYQKAIEDPSADNYHHFRGDDYDSQQLNILDRYKLYNGMDGNSPTSEQSSQLNQDKYPTSQTTRPNEEDINLDNTLDDVESYFQYKVKISKTDVSPNNVGNNYITNVLETNAQTEDGVNRAIKWYQFKIPIQDFERAVGGITDFRSIRFMRIFVKGFEKPVFLRFAQLELVRGEWRRYAENLDSPGAYLPVDEISEFNIAAVNIEENSSKTPVNYILPPDLTREVNVSAGNLQLLNEQSMSLEVCDLKDGEARAAYKSLNVDIRSYQKLKMYVHAEDRNESGLQDDELKLFVRLGADFANNYYEYEIPLKVTAPGFYSTNVTEDQVAVWPTLNNIEIVFEDLFDLKIQRNRAVLDNPGDISVQNRYSKNYGAGKILSIMGNPNLSTIKTIMIGVKNPKDDGLTKCSEIWVNELRLTDFDERGGYAAIGRLNAKLADFANVSIMGSISTPGFGTLENKVNERQKEQIETFNASTTVQLGKLLPEDLGLRLPMYYGYSVNRVTPQFAPQADDVPTKLYEEYMNEAGYKIDSIRQISRDITTRQSLNFTNIRKEKSKKNADKKTRFYNISNFTGTYAYSEQDHHNFDLENDRLINHKGGLTYSFNATPKPIEPLKKAKVFNSKHLKIIKDFNFYLAPKQIGFSTNINRMYNEKKMRNNVPGTLPLETFVNKNLTFDRNYNLNYDLTKALQLTFSANNRSLINENDGVIDDGDRWGYLWSDSLIREQVFSLRNMTTTDYRHNTSLNYTLPFSKIPLTNWINSSIRYTSSYNWQRASFAKPEWGNTVQNSQNINFNNTFNMLNLYNKVPYLKKVNQKANKNKRRKPVRKPTSNQKTDNKKEEKDKDKLTIPDRFAKLFMSTKNINANYSLTSGILLPGYKPKTMVIGMDEHFEGPGLGFLFGQQNFWGGNDTMSFAQYAQQNNWLVNDSTLNKQYTETLNEKLSINATIEPVNDMRIQLKTNYQYGTQHAEYYRYQGAYYGDGNQWLTESPVTNGNFSASIITWKTAFDKTGDSTYHVFLENRETISERLGEIDDKNSGSHAENPNYEYGYGPTSPMVMIPAFLAAYTGDDPEKVNLDPFNVGIKGIKQLPLPNWQIRYTGLSKIEKLRTLFKSVTLNHQYQSTYAVGSFLTNIDYYSELNDAGTEIPVLIDTLSSNFVPKYQINSVTIQEKFNPLINIDMTWKNSLITRFEIKKDRTLSFALTNAQITEIQGNAIVVGVGYTIQQVPLPFELRPGTPVQSDLRLMADFTYRRTETVIRKIVEDFKQTSAGQRNFSVKITADYKLSDKLNMRAFYDFNKNDPFVSTSNPSSNAKFGVTLMFTLAP